jgi:hypothetical protein
MIITLSRMLYVMRQRHEYLPAHPATGTQKLSTHGWSNYLV